MSPNAMAGGFIGLALAAGVLLVWRGLPRSRRPTLDERLAPYLGPIGGSRGGTPSDVEVMLADRVLTPFPTMERILRPYIAKATQGLERLLGGADSVRRRLDRAGSTSTVQEFRLEQLIWGAAFAGAGLLFSVALLARGARSPFGLLIVCAAAAVAGVVACDYHLTARVKVRERRMMAEFPTVADLLALAVTAGVGPMAALERVAARSGGELAGELCRALGEARAGASLTSALDGVADRTALVPLARFADGVAVALERGTPLSDVLRAQAADVREAHKRSLLEIGGRKEIAMLVPVVFLVLPTTVIFALYPGLVQISTVVP
jgi:tight adherence protein C